ncbi:MAG: glycosyltransferase family 4 protein [Verrucomicrobiales bacterium]|nr:glycosyltransferase family 4 protein [Verrucomicrobiales bacterium]
MNSTVRMPVPSAKPRLAYLFSRYPVVSQTFCDSEMLALERRGFDIEIGSLNRPPTSFRHERLDRLNAEIHYPPPPDVLAAFCDEPEFREKLQPMVDDHAERYGTGYKPLTRARNAFYMARIFRQLGVQHVHVHFANRATHSALFLKKLGFPFSFTAHAQDFMFDLGSNELLNEMAREAEFVVAVSDYSRDLLREMCPDNEAKMVRIYNGIDLDDFRPTVVKQQSPLRVVSIGRLIEFKGFHHLIGACARLKQMEIPVETRIIGEGPLRPELEARIQREGLQDRVKLLGVRSQEQIKSELAEADLFALASVVDPVGASDILPTVITEAMACHLPVVSTTVTGIPEMVEHETTGLLVEPGDEDALAQAISRLSADPDTRARMGAAGRQRAERLFTFDVTAGALGERLIEHYANRSPATERQPGEIVYLVHQWQGEALLKSGPTLQDGVRWLAEHAIWPAEGGDRDTLRSIEILPDASVIESIWLQRTDARATLEAHRGTLGDHVTGTAFYQQARHAIYLAEALPRRGVRHIHARRADTVLTVWMLKLLLPHLTVSAAVEENPSLPRSLLARLLPTLDLLSVSDPKLAEQTGSPPDTLQLTAPFVRKETRIGPLKFKRKISVSEPDRPPLEAAFLARIRELLP